MATLSDARKALRTTIEYATGLRGYWYVPDALQIPCFVVRPDAGEVLAFQRGVAEYALEVTVIAGNIRDEGSQEDLDELLSPMGARSIIAAIHAAPTLGTDANEAPAGSPTMNARALSFREYRPIVVGDAGAVHWSAVVPVVVAVRGDQ